MYIVKITTNVKEKSKKVAYLAKYCLADGHAVRKADNIMIFK
jgi:hypothetical protein